MTSRQITNEHKMTTSKHRRFIIVRNLLGGCLIFLNNEPFFYWGNMAIYVTSYALKQDVTPSADADDQVSPSWVYAFFSPCWVIAMVTSGYLSKFVNARILLALAILLQNISCLASYFLIEVSPRAVYIVFGIFIGLGCGFYEGILQQHFILNLSKKHASFFSSTVMAGAPIGGLLVNQFVTWYTNPRNLSPDAIRGSMDVFTQNEVLSNVPAMLLVLSISFPILQFLGLLILQEVPESFDVETEECNNERSVANNYQTIETTHSSILSSPSSSSSSPSSSLSSPSSPFASATTPPTTTAQIEDNNKNVPENTNGRGIRASASDSDDLDIIKHGNGSDNNNSSNEAKNYTPREMIRCSNFYKLSFVYMLGVSARLVSTSYYKLYGQVWIHDDHYLTNLGTTQAVMEIPITILWGYVTDRIGVKSSMVTMFAGSALSLLAMYFTARFNRWLYFASTIFATGFAETYTCFFFATYQWFGRDNYSVNVGIMDTISMLGIDGPTLVLDFLIARFGHFVEFGWAASSCVIGLVIIVVSFPRD